MKKKRFFVFAILCLIPLTLCAFGFRFHGDALKSRMGYESREFRKVNLKSGRMFVGEILSETPDSLKMTFEGGAMTFSRSEIKSMELIDPKTAAYGEYADEVVLLPKRPIITFRPEDRWFYKAPQKKVRYIDSNLKQVEDEDASGMEKAQKAMAKNLEAALKFSQDNQKTMKEKTAQQEKMMRQIEGDHSES